MNIYCSILTCISGTLRNFNVSEDMIVVIVVRHFEGSVNSQMRYLEEKGIQLVVISYRLHGFFGEQFGGIYVWEIVGWILPAVHVEASHVLNNSVLTKKINGYSSVQYK